MKIAVVGGGVVGLTTASLLQNGFMHNAEITVLAESFDQDIVSYVAAGIFRVASTYHGPYERTKKWIEDSYEYYDNIRRANDASLAGVTDISGYIFANSSPRIVQNHWLEPVVPLYRRATEEELQLANGNWKYGSFFSTLRAQCDLYLPWIGRKLQTNGVTLKKQHIDSFHELLQDFDIIMNCTGFGARNLCNENLVAIRGQVHQVRAPWIKLFFYGELDTYVIPGVEGAVTLGGSRSYDCEIMDPCPYEQAAIMKRCTRLIPSLESLEIVRTKVGLRPHREGGVRVAGDIIADSNGKAIIVHNYGHGGYGVSMAPGTAIEAIDTAVQLHKSSSTKCKL